MIVRLTGGLGNQMFGYAFGRALSLSRNESVQFHWGRATRDYELDKYEAPIELVQPPFGGPLYEEPGFAFDPNAQNAPLNTYFRGYWQSPKYFEKYADVIRRELTLKKRIFPWSEVGTLAEKLRNENSVFIHVRRGDYLNPGTQEVHGILPWQYYKDARNYIQEKISSPKFYYFSDDPDWVRNNFYTDFSLGEETVISGFNQHEDFYLMQACRHGIGANSSFSWWANWLADSSSRFSWWANWLADSSSRVKIAPKRWFLKDLDTRDLIPEHWVKI